MTQVGNQPGYTPRQSSVRTRYTEISTAAGRVYGLAQDGLLVFRGIRYAETCTMATRFRAPQPLKPGQALQTGDDSGPAPMQPRRGTKLDAAYGDIDCLNLSIWMPEPASVASDGAPVMVWIPGGGFMRCDANDALYDGSSFAKQGIVVVAVNYRVGIDGFLHLPGMTANRGLLDQIQALEWIQRNIHDFGGDPSRVTIFGVSAGAGSIACLMGNPVATGLFHQAILQSPSVLVQTEDEACAMSRAIAELAGCKATPEGFAALAPEVAVRALAVLSADAELRSRHGLGSHHRFPLRPVLDGSLLVHQPIDAIAQNAVLPDAVLCGANSEEARLYLVPDGSIDRITARDVEAFVTDAGMPADSAQVYREKLPPGQSTDGEVLCAIQSDYYYRQPARDIVQTMVMRGSNAFSYEFCWRSPLYEGALGAAHGVELPFVFNNLDNETARNFIDIDAFLPLGLARSMHEAWGHFVKHGNPGWPAQIDGQQQIMRFDGVHAAIMPSLGRG